MTAGAYNLVVDQRTTLHRVITWKQSNGSPVDLTGYTAHLQVRQSADAASTVFDLTDVSGLTLGGALGTITIDISATALAAVDPGTYEYDLLMTAGSNVTKLLAGEFTITPTITATGSGSNPSPSLLGLVDRRFPISWNTPHISDGVGAELWTPNVGDWILALAVEIIAGWNTSPAMVDLGGFLSGDRGWFAVVGTGAIDVTSGTESAASGWENLALTPPAVPVNKLITRPISASAPVKACVTQNGLLDGASPGATAGQLILHVFMVSPS